MPALTSHELTLQRQQKTVYANGYIQTQILNAGLATRVRPLNGTNLEGRNFINFIVGEVKLNSITNPASSATELATINNNITAFILKNKPVVMSRYVSLVSQGYLPISKDQDAIILKYSTTGVLQWYAVIQGTSNYEIVNTTITDSTGVYITTRYNSTSVTPLYNGDGTDSGKSLPISSDSGCIIKYNTAGLIQWSIHVLPTSGIFIPYKITTDSTDLYVTGTYGSTSTVTLYNGDGTDSGKSLPISSGNQNIYIIKYNSSGTVQWYINIPEYEGGYGITTDSTDVYVIGRYQTAGTVALNNADGTSSGKSLPRGLTAFVFIIKYDTDGDVQWYTTIPCLCGNTGGITTNSSGVYATGFYNSSSTVTLYNQDGTDSGKSLPISSNFDAFLIKYSTAGVVQWYTVIQGNSIDYSFEVKADSTGIYTTGLYSSTSTVTLYNGNGTDSGKSLPTTSSYNPYIIKYSNAGVVQWYTTIAGGSSIGFGVTTDSTGVYASGTYSTSSTITLYNGDGTDSGKSLPTDSTSYIIKYNTSGDVQYVIKGNAGIRSITTDSTGIYAAGYYYSTTSLPLYNGS
jgi:hypothetical protein